MRTTRRGYLAAVPGTAAGLSGCLGSLTGGGSAGNCEAATSGTVSELPAPVAGDPEADVTVMAFEDFSCPHCRTYSLEIFPKVREQFVDPGKVRYEFHDFPIPVSRKWSWAAASAARAVQDRVDDAAFYDYAHALFENQGDYSMSLIEDLAEDTEATPCAVRAAAENETYRPVSKADRQRGQDMGVSGTPAVFVDGEYVRQATFSNIEAAIQSKL
jgi:protein-disulfide isomerase